MTTRTWSEVTTSDRCPACGSKRWCQVSDDGEILVCQKGDGHAVNGVAPESKINKAGQPIYVYRWTTSYTLAAEPSVGSSTTRADADTLDRVYRGLVAELSNSKTATRRHLAGRGLSVEVVEELLRQGVCELPPRGRYAIAKSLVEQGLERELAATPGFCIGERDGRQFWTIAGYSGFLIPCRDLQGRIVGMQVRLSAATLKQNAKLPKYMWLSSKSRRGASPGAPCHVPAFGGERSVVRVTEGVLKSEIATRLSGMLTVGTPGTAVSGVADIVRAIEPSEVRLAYDPEYETNPLIYAAVEKLIHDLRPLPLKLVVEVWPLSAGKGIDDLLLAGVTPEQITPEQFIERFQGKAQQSKPTGQKVKRIREVAEAYLSDLGEHEDLLSTGLPELDRALGGGISPGSRIVLGGRPGHGKSALGQFLLSSLASQRQRCLFISCEMTERQVGKRATMQATRLHSELWRSHLDTVLEDVQSEYDGTRDFKLATDVCDLRNIIDLVKAEHQGDGLDVALLDYLQLVDAPGRTEFDKVTNTSREMTQLAKELNITLVMLAQLNRGIEKRGGVKGEKSDFMPQLSDLRGSGQIEQDADVIIFGVYPCKLDQRKPKSEYVLKVAKCRDRDSNPAPFHVSFEASRMRFADEPAAAPTRHTAFDDFNREEGF